MSITLNPIAAGAWLRPAGIEDIADWHHHGLETPALLARLDFLFQSWLSQVAPALCWDRNKSRLLGAHFYDGYIPDRDAVTTIRRQLAEALEDFEGNWRRATLDDLLNLTLEHDAASYRHSEKRTRPVTSAELAEVRRRVCGLDPG